MAQIVIDVSSHQNPAAFNFAELKKHISGAILRVGRTFWGTGSSYGKDEQFEAFYKACKQHGVPVGAYWYSCADTTAEAMAEADKCFEWGLRGKQFELPIYWDTEDEHHQRKAAKGQLTHVAQAFLERLESRGYYVGIYASASWLNGKLDMDALKDYDVWVAHYGVSKPAYNRPYGLWQYSSTARIAGYSGNLDASYMYKDYPAIIKTAGLNGWPKQAAKPTGQAKESKMLKDKNVMVCYKNDGDYANAIALLNGLTGLCKSATLIKGDNPFNGFYTIQVGGAAIKGADKVLSGKDRRDVLINIGKYLEEVAK